MRTFNLADNELTSIAAFASRIAVLSSKPDIKADDDQAAVVDDLLVGDVAERAFEKIDDLKADGAGAQVVPIETAGLGAHDGEDISPLPIRDAASALKPAELLQEDVFRRVDPEALSVSFKWSHCDTALQQCRVQRRATSNEEITFTDVDW